MQLTTEDRGSARLVTVAAPRIDAAVAIQFKDAVRLAATGRAAATDAAAGDAGPAPDAAPAIAAQDPQADRVILDLSAVTFLDSSGLGALVAAMKLLAPRRLDLAGLTPNVQRVFRLTRMDTVFAIYPTAEDAVGGSRRFADAG